MAKYSTNDDRPSVITVSFRHIVICCLGATKIEGSREEMTFNIFQNCDGYFEDANVTCDPESVLNDDRDLAV